MMRSLAVHPGIAALTAGLPVWVVQSPGVTNKTKSFFLVPDHILLYSGYNRISSL